eukprot:Gb_14621 [translate_table: standard]
MESQNRNIIRETVVHPHQGQLRLVMVSSVKSRRMAHPYTTASVILIIGVNKFFFALTIPTDVFGVAEEAIWFKAFFILNTEVMGKPGSLLVKRVGQTIQMDINCANPNSSQPTIRVHSLVKSPELPREALRGGVQHNGDRPSPSPDNRRGGRVRYYSTASIQKLKRFNTLILVLRLVTFCFSLAASIFMAMNTHTPGNDGAGSKAKWYDYDAFRYVLAANAIICIYSLAQTGVVMWELLKGDTLLLEMIQVWFDFGHDQAFAYLLFSASSAGTTLAENLRSGHVWIASDHTCNDVNVFCVQADIAIALGFAAFLFLASVSLLSGFRVASFIITGVPSEDTLGLKDFGSFCLGGTFDGSLTIRSHMGMENYTLFNPSIKTIAHGKDIFHSSM